MRLIGLLATLSLCIWAGVAEDLEERQWMNGQTTSRAWSPTTTTQHWTPTTMYQSVWVSTTTITQVVVITQAPNAVITVTSYVPFPVTQTTVYHCYTCNTQTPVSPGQPGTITETVYSTETSDVSLVTRTTTSGIYVLLIVEATTLTGSSAATQSVRIGKASIAAPLPLSWLYGGLSALSIVVLDLL